MAYCNWLQGIGGSLSNSKTLNVGVATDGAKLAGGGPMQSLFDGLGSAQPSLSDLPVFTDDEGVMDATSKRSNKKRFADAFKEDGSRWVIRWSVDSCVSASHI